MDLTALLKPSLSEVAAFTKRNAQNMAIVGDLRAARDGCQTKEARAMIEAEACPSAQAFTRSARSATRPFCITRSTSTSEPHRRETLRTDAWGRGKRPTRGMSAASRRTALE